MTLTEKLNKYECSFKTSKTGVSLDVCPDDDSLAKDGTVTDPDLNAFLDLIEKDDFFVWIDTCPYDRRVGLVCCVEYKGESSWYDENGDCEWV